MSIPFELVRELLGVKPRTILADNTRTALTRCKDSLDFLCNC